MTSVRLPGGGPLSGRLHIGAPERTAVQRALWKGGLGGYEPATMAALLASFSTTPAGFVFFDVGANIGIYSLLCARLFRPGGVVAFEPTPDVAAIAAELAAANRLQVDVRRLALGAAPGTADLFLSAKSDSSNSLVAGFKKSKGTVSVDVSTIDEIVGRGGRPPDIVKIDVELYEAEVLTGALAVIRAHRPQLIVEVLHRRGVDQGPALMSTLDGLGYRYFRLPADGPPLEEPVITGDPAGKDREWLLLPGDPHPELAAQVVRWREALSRCGPPRPWRTLLRRSRQRLRG